jgi:phage shock protein PspC (stress-responsive transcriptional regulator)
MRLTQKQQWLIDRYLLAVGNELGDVPDSTRELAAAHVRNKIAQGLRQLDAGPHSDAEILRVLQQIGAPAHAASIFLEQRGVEPVAELNSSGATWLGVCSGLADYWGMNPRQMRAAAFALGVITGPLALAAYVAAYAILYRNTLRSENGTALPRVQKLSLAKTTVLTVGGALLVHVIGLLSLFLLPKAYLLAVPQKTAPALGAWGWLHANTSFLLFWALALSVPWSILSGLPMVRGWDQTARRIAYAILALYAAMVSCGIASYLVGLLLAAIKNFGVAVP